MKISQIKDLMISSLSSDSDAHEISGKLAETGISYNFNPDFKDRIVEKLFSASLKVTREIEFVKYMNFAFYRVALTGVAAIVVLLISIFFMEGSLSLNSFLGLSDNYNESIVCLLTGK
jgi:hypothetical protein